MKAWPVLLLVLAGCAHSADPTFFALSSRPGRALEGRPLKVELRRAALPGYLDRPHIVRRATAERLELTGDERWGAPLDEMVGATLAENLAQRLPHCVVFSDSGAISAPADLRVEVQLLRFERSAAGDTELIAEVAVHSSVEAPATIQRFALEETPNSATTAATVASLSRLLGQLADGIAQLIQQQASLPTAQSGDALR
jgi:uncharacterized lipoprotein YmbA